MQQYLKPIIIGLVITFVVVFGFGLIGIRGLPPVMFGLFLGVFTAYILANLAGTKAGPKADAAQKGAALSEPTPGKGRLVVSRQGFLAMAAGMIITVDGRQIAQLKSPNWTAIDLEPGAHTLTAAFTGLAEKQSNAANTAFEIRDGEIIVFKLGMSMGALKNSITAERVAADQTIRTQLQGQKMILAT